MSHFLLNFWSRLWPWCVRSTVAIFAIWFIKFAEVQINTNSLKSWKINEHHCKIFCWKLTKMETSDRAVKMLLLFANELHIFANELSGPMLVLKLNTETTVTQNFRYVCKHYNFSRFASLGRHCVQKPAQPSVIIIWNTVLLLKFSKQFRYKYHFNLCNM